MTLHRFFVTGALPSEGETAPVGLSEADRHHLTRVLRLKPGERIIVADAGGTQAEAVLADVSAQAVTAVYGPTAESVPRPRVVLAQAVSRRERMELTVQKATELGVSEIWPVLTARCVVRLDEQRSIKRAERWSRIAEEAAKQSQRSVVPVVREPMSLRELVDAAGSEDVVLVPWEEAAASAPGIGAALDEAGAKMGDGIVVVIGPEGGLEPAEVDALKAAGAHAVSLGDTVLRTETAAIAAVAIVSYEMGALGGRGR